tara:strand:- start:46 stop:1536 length:1491 start_codon:yes stop_codon:yes gene_type:complete
MQIFPNEIKDGVADLVQSSASIAYCAPALLCHTSEENYEGSTATKHFAEKVKADSANPKQVDLYYIKSVLVSTGWNKNDDVFSPQATWAARTTPEDKQFNLMHNENDIIGHITGSYVVNREGDKIQAEEAPSEFDIITEAVLYNSWTEPENRERMRQIIAEIEEGKWFVSMECLFAGFDYAVVDPAGKASVLERNEGSAFLTKHLRAYGGTGEYEGKKIGRSLRDISFSGKGLVSKPANPRSVILDASRASSDSSNDNDLLTLGGSDMSDTNVLEQQLAEVRSELASAKEENVSLRASIEEATSKEQGEALAKLESALAEKEEAIKALEASVAEKETSITELQETIAKSEADMKEKMEELRKMQKEKKMEARKASLIEAGLDADEAEESLASYEDMDDDTFSTILTAMDKMKKKYAMPPEEKEKMKKEEATPPKPKAEEIEAEEAEEAEAEVKAEEALEDVETTEATLVDASDESDELEATRASVAEWLEKNVLSK